MSNSENFLSIVLKIEAGLFRIASIKRHRDGSFYFSPVVTKATEKIAPGLSVKYSYHQTGERSRYTIDMNGRRFAEMGSEDKSAISLIKTSSQGSPAFSFSKVQTLGVLLDEDRKDSGKYLNRLEINGSKYENLTVIMFLVAKNFSLDHPTENYKEVFRFFGDEIDLVVATKDEWLGDKPVDPGRKVAQLGYVPKTSSAAPAADAPQVPPPRS